jgi:serine/threonine protein kinase
VTSGLKANEPIQVKICDVFMLNMIKLKNSNGGNYHIQGVDRIHLAPEQNEMAHYTHHNDIYSVGTILYLLVTGGVNDKKHDEKFDMNENAIINVEEDMRDFILGMISNAPTSRPSVSTLLKHYFLQKYRLLEGEKPKHEIGHVTYKIEDTFKSEEGYNMYKFQVASVMNDIFIRQSKLHQKRLRSVEELKRVF